MSTTTSPSNSELVNALRALRVDNPSTGAAKLLAKLQQANPTWTVSEKRLRKTLQQEGLSAVGSPNGSIPTETGTNEAVSYPISHIVPSLDPSKWTQKVCVKFFGLHKGKGLVATEDIAENETIWVEDPLLLSPETELDDLQRGAQACLHCAKPIRHSGGHPIECRCSGMFCNRLCSSRGNPAHAYLCPVQNPASVPFMDHIRQEKWKAPGAWARVAAILFALASRGDPGAKDLENTLDFMRGLAGLSLDKRVRLMTNWEASQTASEALWRRTHKLLVETFLSPSNSSQAKALSRLKGKNLLSEDIAKELFEYDAFLLGLGKMSLNLEAHGGLYMFHSHINHSCSPNISVRHLTPNNIQRVTVIARRAIIPGEELVVSYVDPSGTVSKRRRELKEWGFGACTCQRCLEEKNLEPINGEASVQLENEIRGFLGV